MEGEKKSEKIISIVIEQILVLWIIGCVKVNELNMGCMNVRTASDSYVLTSRTKELELKENHLFNRLTISHSH